MSLKALLTGELTLGIRIRNVLLPRSYATVVDAPKEETIDITSVDKHPKFTDELSVEIEDVIKAKRNKSRLSDSHRNILNEQRPYDDPGPSVYHQTRIYKIRMLGRYGLEGSGVHAGIAWPTKKEIALEKEYERVAYPRSLQASWTKIANRHAYEEKRIRDREQDIMAKLAKTGQWEKELNARIAKKEAEVLAARERKDRLVEEVRRHFGFKVDPRDERFKEMLEKKDKEDKKRRKDAKKKEREKQIMEKLLGGKEALADGKKSSTEKTPTDLS